MTSLKSINRNFIYTITYSQSESVSCLIGSTYKAVTISGPDNLSHPSIREAIDLISSEKFSQNFLKAGRAFVINVQCRGSMLPLDPQQLAVLVNSYKDRPMIFYFESQESGFCVYYKDNSAIKCATNISTISIDEFYNSEFSFELLLRAMRSKFGGNFSETFADLQLNVMPLVDEWRLIDLAVLGNNQLCIRFLQLFENSLESVDNFSIRLLQNAARMCNFESMLAIFDVNFEQKDFGLKINRDLLNVKDSSAFNLLMISVECGNVSATIFWLNLNFFDVNYETNGIKAADLACKLKNSEILLMLLQNDSKYPKNYHKIDKSVELQMFSNKINEIHEAIKLSDIKNAKEVLYNLKLRYYFNESNKSAAYAALENREFEIYKLLMMNNSTIGSHEDLVTLNLDEEAKVIIKFIHDRYKSALYEKCVLDVEKRIKCLNILEIHRQKYQFEVRNSLNLLFDVESFRPILRIIAVSDVDFILDFERDSVNYLDPSEGPGTRGYFSNSSIFIACKNLLTDDQKNLFLATLIHEMTHFVVNFLYGNCCRPFHSSDAKRAKDFHEVYEACKRNSKNEKIIDAVYGYEEKLRYSELIVRPNHLIAHYLDNEEMRKECETNFPELFKFYRERIHPDMLSALGWLDGHEEIDNSPKRKRKVSKIHKDCNFDVEAQNLLERPKKLEKFSKCQFLRKNLKFFGTSFAAFVVIILILCTLIWKFSHSEGNNLPKALKLITPQCSNITNPLTDLITSKNLTEIENYIENIKNSAQSPSDEFNKIFSVNSTCNPITISIETHPDDLNFAKDMIDVVEDAFEDCKSSFKQVLVQSYKYLKENCDEIKEIFNFVNSKLNKLLDFKEHRSFIAGRFEEIGGKC
ncbi:uncharacterized protein [Chironomus tepperi]|uniref:uncharacterized protein n=1 Tax=Chironomus tepperi TaxID=113505 RepID=UPI00391F71AD